MLWQWTGASNIVASSGGGNSSSVFYRVHDITKSYFRFFKSHAYLAAAGIIVCMFPANAISRWLGAYIEWSQEF